MTNTQKLNMIKLENGEAGNKHVDFEIKDYKDGTKTWPLRKLL